MNEEGEESQIKTALEACKQQIVQLQTGLSYILSQCYTNVTHHVSSVYRSSVGVEWTVSFIVKVIGHWLCKTTSVHSRDTSVLSDGLHQRWIMMEYLQSLYNRLPATSALYQMTISINSCYWLTWHYSQRSTRQTEVKTSWSCMCVVDLNHSRAEHDTMKRQAESTNREYDRLMKEHTGLQVSLRSVTPCSNVLTAVVANKKAQLMQR